MINSIKVICSDLSAQIEFGKDKTVGDTLEKMINQSIKEGFTPRYETVRSVAA